MNTDQAIQNLQNLLDACVQKGNIFKNTHEVMVMQASLSLLKESIKTNQNGNNETQHGPAVTD
jgi:hypothetical protein